MIEDVSQIRWLHSPGGRGHSKVYLYLDSNHIQSAAVHDRVRGIKLYAFEALINLHLKRYIFVLVGELENL